MKKLFLRFAFGLLPIVIILGMSPLQALAGTHVSGVLTEDTVWSADQGPYLLDDNVTVPDGVTLTIGAGVSLTTASEFDQDEMGYKPVINVTGGHIHAAGNTADHISIANTDGISVIGGSSGTGSADIAYMDLRGGAYFYFENAHAAIASSTISDASTGINLKDSTVSVWGSRLENNDVGIEVVPHSIFLSKTSPSRYGVGGIGNALADLPVTATSSTVFISDSVLVNNTSRAIKNNSEFIVTAMNNWWGSAGGPQSSGINSVKGQITYAPWLSVEPMFTDPPPDKPCCSSVLFIPGLEGSRLYRPEPRPLGFGTSVNQLWEPNRNADVQKLYLNSYGSSTDSTIYSGAPIDKALGFVDIYGRFMNFLGGLAQKGTISEWRAFGYDWRKPIPEVVLGNNEKATTTENLITVIDNLARNSKTGKVNIVAHSNGGLIAKYLVKVLVDMGKSDLIDSVVSVAVPYLGTPTAIPSLLHGDDTAILGGLIASQSNMRSLGINMPSAYSLLPSREFFTRIFTPTIVFASSSVHSFDDQAAFIVDTANTRQAPTASNTSAPIRGNKLLMAAADILHGILDPFVWPANIARWAIVGWNSTTTEGILYTGGSHVAAQDLSGDGTVKSQSADYNSGQVFATDLRKQSLIEGHDVAHMNILEASTTKSAINAILSNSAESNSKVIDEVSRLPGITIGSLDWNAMDATYNANRKELRISTHSPVKLHIYDTHGNHTGEIPLPPEIASQVEAGLYTMKEEKVPGSTYDVLGCENEDIGDCDTQITLPDNNESYTAVVDGVGTGTFTLDIERIRATSTIERVEWSDIPVTTNTRASTTFTGYPNFAVSNKNLASSTSPLAVDLNGNGIANITINPGATIDRDKNPFWTALRECLRRLKLRNLTTIDRAKIFDEARTLFKKFH